MSSKFPFSALFSNGSKPVNGRVKARGQRRRAKSWQLESLESRELMAADLGRVVAPGIGGTLPGGGGGASIETGVLGNVGSVGDPEFEGPALSAKFANGVITVTGSDYADNLSIYVKNGQVHVREVVQNRMLLSVPLSTVRSIRVNANAGNDWINIDESVGVSATLYGNSGNDTLQGGSGADFLFGGTGNDELVGRGGVDSLYGNEGNDLLIGGDGNDILYGDAGDDYMLGGNGNDWMLGGDGNDQMYGEAGDDLMFGAAGENLMDGGSGNDTIFGGDNADAVYAGEGNDVIYGGLGDDRLRGEGGIDQIYAEAGDDIADGGQGADYIVGGEGNDALHGGAGNDQIFGGNGQDWIEGGTGADKIYGNAGSDYLLGGAGTDQVDGGTGTNQVFQDGNPSQPNLGTVSQELSWGDFTEFVSDVWDGIADAFAWTVDKIQAIATRFYDWATQIDDRIVRLGADLADALSNWPWKVEFWTGLGRSVIDALEVIGLGEAWEVAFEVLKPWQRGMNSNEISVARSVFGNSIPWDRVRLDEHSLTAGIGRTHVTGYIINSTEDISDREMIHELTHVWQYVKDGLVYIPGALGAQAGEGYDYGGLDALRIKKAEGKRLSDFNREQQGEIVADYFEARQAARVYEAQGQFAPQALRDKLDVYIYFVKEASTLSHAQLDTPEPTLTTNARGRNARSANALAGATR